MTQLSRVERIPTVIKDNSKAYAIVFLLVFGGLYGIGKFFPEFAVTDCFHYLA